jgi:hypothetical protein
MRGGVRFLAVLSMLVALPAVAQTRPSPATTTPAGVKSIAQPLGYRNLHDFQRKPDGSWTARATRNGVERSLIVKPSGTIESR